MYIDDKFIAKPLFKLPYMHVVRKENRYRNKRLKKKKLKLMIS